MHRTALVLSAFLVDGDDLLASCERKDLRPDQVYVFLADPPSLDDDPDLHAGEYEVAPEAVADACALFGMEAVHGVYFIGTVALRDFGRTDPCTFR